VHWVYIAGRSVLEHALDTVRMVRCSSLHLQRNIQAQCCFESCYSSSAAATAFYGSQ
jgi:hypothetical protein